MKYVLMLAVASLAMAVNATTVVVSDDPSVVRDAALREALLQNSTWTSENIQKYPALFLKDQILACDRLSEKIEAQNITLLRIEKRALRTVEDSQACQARYEKFLANAKAAYKAANGKWPVSVNGYELDEEELTEKIYDAMERVDLAKKDLSDNTVIAKKAAIRKGVLKTRKRDLVALRMKLVQQLEQVKMNAALAEIKDLQATLGAIKDMMVEIDEDPAKLSLDNITADDPNAARNKKVKSFLND